ncbi:MAG TPA: hypothetical protein VEC36_12400 [Patescibacteria group bacterium]|nr:hypothetical protein [Patescibacteria group bacterium]
MLFCFAIPLTAVARTESLQADSLSAFTRDTVYNSEPMTEYISFGHIITAGYGYAIVPITIVLGAASISSPTYVMEFDKIYGNHTGFSFGAGVGIDFNEEEGIGFSDIRAQFDYTRLANHPVSPNRSTGSLLADINFMPIFRENIFRLGGSIGPGITISEEVPRYHIQGELWIRNAMGLSYLGLFPQHQLFIRSRYTIGLHNSMPRYDIALGYAATISISKEFFYDFIP